MGDAISAFLSAVPSAAASPLAMIAYLATVAAWIVIAYRVKRFTVLMENIEKLPEVDRIKAIKAEFRNAKIPPRLTAKDYLRQQKQAYILYAFLALCAVIIVVFGMTISTAVDKQHRADGLTEKILSQPSSQLMSSANVLSNGPKIVDEVAAEIGPPPTQRELSDIVDRLVQSGMRDGAQINQRLHEMFGGKLQDVSRTLNLAAGNVDKEFEPLADCYRRAECGKGSRFTEMCGRVRQFSKMIGDINAAASKIPGVMMNTSDAPPLFGSGSIDRYFDVLSAKNLDYLSSQVCP
jgi:hypothetical protein